MFYTTLPCQLSNNSTNYQLHYIFLLWIIDQQQNSELLAWKKFNTAMPLVPYCYTSTWHNTKVELAEYKHDSCKTLSHIGIGSILEVWRPCCAAESTRVNKLVILIFAMHSVGSNLSQVCTFRLQKNSLFSRVCLKCHLYWIYMKDTASWCILQDAQLFVTCSKLSMLSLTKCFSLWVVPSH